MSSARHRGSAGRGEQPEGADPRDWSGRAASLHFEEAPPRRNRREALRRVSGHARTCPDKPSFQKPAQCVAFFQDEPCSAPPDCIQNVRANYRLGHSASSLLDESPGFRVASPFWLQSGADAPDDCAGTVVAPLIRLRRDLPPFRCPSLRSGTPPSKGAQRPTFRLVLPESSF
jgi:hypothetical protein